MGYSGDGEAAHANQDLRTSYVSECLTDPLHDKYVVDVHVVG